MRALVASCAVVLAALSITVDPAQGCSCIPPNPWSYLKEADGAFVGRLVSRREGDHGQAVLTFSVERPVKGKIGSTVEVETANNGAACGIETSVGTRIGLFIDRDGNRWLGHLCWQVAAEDLIAAASLPAPNGRWPVALFVGGRFGPARMMALDKRGRTLGYGSGGGIPTLFSMCPGGQAFAEVAAIRSDARSRTTYEIAIREPAFMHVVRRQRVRLPGWRFATGLQCEDSAGSSVVIFANWAGDHPLRAGIYRLSEGRIRAVWQGNAFLSSFHRGIAYLNAGSGADRLVMVHLGSGCSRSIVWLPRAPRLVPNDAGTRLAGVAYGMNERSRIIVVDLKTRPVAIRSIPLAAAGVEGDVHWLSRDRLLFIPSSSRDTARVLDLELRTLSRFRWTAGQAALAGTHIFAVERMFLVTAKLPSGTVRVLRRLPGRATVIASATR